jgi:hypothetical protein
LRPERLQSRADWAHDFDSSSGRHRRSLGRAGSQSGRDSRGTQWRAQDEGFRSCRRRQGQPGRRPAARVGSARISDLCHHGRGDPAKAASDRRGSASHGSLSPGRFGGFRNLISSPARRRRGRHQISTGHASRQGLRAQSNGTASRQMVRGRRLRSGGDHLRAVGRTGPSPPRTHRFPTRRGYERPPHGGKPGGTAGHRLVPAA